MTFQSLQAGTPTPVLSTSSQPNEYVATGTDAAEYELWKQHNPDGDALDDISDDDLANAGWLPTD